jgi:hypothetical protein
MTRVHRPVVRRLKNAPATSGCARCRDLEREIVWLKAKLDAVECTTGDERHETDDECYAHLASDQDVVLGKDKYETFEEFKARTNF